MATDHYENFPVASLLMPARLRPAVLAIYAFARSADDIADEGDALPATRLAALDAYSHALLHMHEDPALVPQIFRQLHHVVSAWNLPLRPFQDLLSAFRQDVMTVRYADFDGLLEYCARSANPVGNLMLHLYGVPTPDNIAASDAICSALQLINFCQDISIDWKKGRIYLPLDDLERFGVTPGQIAAGCCDTHWQALMRFQLIRTRALLLSGAPLALRLRGRFGWELRLVVQGGLRILDRIEAVDYDVFMQRPVLRKRDWMAMIWAAVCMRQG